MMGSAFFFRTVRMLTSLGLLTAATAVMGLAVLVQVTARDLPKLPQTLSRLTELPKTQILAKTGEELLVLGAADPVPLSRVSSHFINAVIATEDHRFWSHHGINKLRTLKALYITLVRPGEIQGASTITQQLAKNLFFSFDRSWRRKFREMLVAFQIETVSTKQEILQAYVNQIHFGAGAQGVEQAARIFFDKPASDLTLSEAALLAGLPKSPTRYNPFRYFQRAMDRRAVVLGRMLEEGYITRREWEETLSMKPELSPRFREAKPGSYFIDALLQDLVERYGEDVVFHGGIRIYATLDPALQYAAEEAVKNGLERLDLMLGLKNDSGPHPQGALVAVDTATGAVKAMVGGRDYGKSEFNRAVNSRRQPGSGFKPFVYYTAFNDAGMHGATVVEDAPVTVPVTGSPDWSPQNVSGTFQGPMILKHALTRSVNTVAARLVVLTGPEAVKRTAEACGITRPLNPVYSLALGTEGVTPLEMASSFSTFASGGVRHKPFLFWRIEDALGNVIDETFVRGDPVLDPAIAFQVVDMMASVVDRGSASVIRRLGFIRPAAGKTGTTDGYKDAWFTGFTPSLSVSVWTGFDREGVLKKENGGGISGGMAAAPIWADFMNRALAGQPERAFPIPGELRFETVDGQTGCRVLEGDNALGYRVPLRPGQSICKGDGT